MLLSRYLARRAEAPTYRRRLSFEERMAELGLARDEGALSETWEGHLGGRRVRVVRFEDRMSDPPLVAEVSTAVPSGQLKVAIGDPEQTAIRGSRHIGDAEFDPWFEVEGDLEDLALLTPELRRTLRNVAHHARPRIQHGWVSLTGPASVDVDSRIAPMVALASLVETAALDASARIRRFAQDPDSGVRLRCLEMLSARPTNTITAAVARDRLDDPDPIVRTLAAVLVGDANRLVAIAQAPEHAPAVRRRAARALLETGSEAQKFAVATSLATGPTPLHKLAYDLVEALGNAAEPVLITLVGSPNAEVARGAAGVLGRIGTIRAIPALREFQSRTGQLEGPLRPELARAIQSMRITPSANRRKADAPTRPLTQAETDEQWLDDALLQEETATPAPKRERGRQPSQPSRFGRAPRDPRGRR
ncbi:MAG: hypothetical protein R3F59_17280 [Myxococcota bacterium]